MATWRDLLVTHKTFLDPIHGDIHLSALETAIVDTSAFQRLARVRQLGFANMVYRGAVHTRFEHSLGTHAVAVRMIAAVNGNPHAPVSIPDRAKVVIRLASLLHDIAHIPSGHTLEDELGLMPRHDTETEFERLLGATTEIGQLIERSIGLAFDPSEGREAREQVVKVLSAKDDDQIAVLPYPYAADIIGNTICADLIDYLARDAYFTGLPERFRERFLDYMFISSEGDLHGNYKSRVVLRLFKWSTKQLRSDNLSDIISLLRYRYRNSERVYFHHTKMKAGAMIGRALLETPLATKRELFYERQYSDDSLVDALLKERSKAAEHVASALRDRRLYSNVVEINFAGIPEKDRLLAQQCLYRLRPASEYLKWTSEIEERFYLRRGDVLFYIPPAKMQLKEADVLVAVEGDRDIRRLQDIGIQMPEEEVRHIQEQHRNLWRFHLLVHPEIPFETGLAVARYFQERCAAEFDFSFENQAPRYRSAIQSDHRNEVEVSLDAAISRFLRDQNTRVEAPERDRLRVVAQEAARRDSDFGKQFQREQLPLGVAPRVFGKKIEYATWHEIISDVWRATQRGKMTG